MEYVIRNFDETLGQITVEYENKWVYSIDLPIENGAFPIGEKLEEVIQGMAPIWLAERQNSLSKIPENTERIRELVQPFQNSNKTTIQTNLDLTLKESAMESDIAFIAEIVNEVLASKGL